MKRRWFVLLVVMGAWSVSAQQPTPAPTAAGDWADWSEIEKLYTPEAIAKMDESEAKQNLQQVSAREAAQRADAFADFKRGAGLGLTIAPASDGEIEDALVVDKKIVVTKQNTNAARMMFEFHQLFTTNVFTSAGRDAARAQLQACELNAINCPMFGVGPFLSLQTSSESAVDSVGIGLMAGLRNDPRKDTSFNLGIGVQWDSRVRQLADGFVAGQPLPAGETEIRFKQKGRARLMIGLSLGF
jgi:hypothetical protein